MGSDDSYTPSAQTAANDVPTGPAPDVAPAPNLVPVQAGATRPGGPIDVVGAVSAAVDQIGAFVRPEAAVAVAREFTFPLALTAVVLAFLVVQNQLDRRDPKLRMAPQSTEDTFIRFTNEEGS